MVTASQCVFSTELLNYCFPSALGYSVAVSLGLGISDRLYAALGWGLPRELSLTTALQRTGMLAFFFFS